MECIGETMNEDRFFRVLVAHSLQNRENIFELAFFLSAPKRNQNKTVQTQTKCE